MKTYRGLIISIIILAAILALSGCSSPAPTPAPAQVNTPAPSSASIQTQAAPDFQLTNLSGDNVSLRDFRGHVVLLNFWATWCPPCRGEMPYLEQIYQKYKDSNLVMLEVDAGEGRDTVAAFAKNNGLTMPILVDSDSRVSDMYNITAIPTTFILDKDGIIQNKRIGAFPDMNSIEQAINSVLK